MTENKTTSTEIASEYEARLLGSLLLNPAQYEDVADIVGFDDFIFPDNAHIYQTIAAIREAKEPVHPLSVADNIGRAATIMGQQPRITISTLQALATTSSPMGARSDAIKVRERADLRRIADAGSRIREQADNASATPEEIMEGVREVVESATLSLEGRGHERKSNFVPYVEVMTEYITHLSALSENPEQNPGIYTGIPEIDEYLGFLSPGMHVLAARPGGGKTALANIIFRGAYESTERGVQTVGGLYHSIDMGLQKLMMRFLAERSGVSISALKSGKLSDQDWTQVAMGLEQNQALADRAWFDPTRDLTTVAFHARVRRYVREKKSRNGLVVLDYLQLLRPPATTRLGLGNPLDYVSRAVADIAEEENVVVIALAQMNRMNTGRANKRPILADLKGSGQIEADSDSVFFLHRDEHAPNIIEFIAAKNREATPDHTIDLGFKGSCQQFYPVDQRTAEERIGGESYGR